MGGKGGTYRPAVTNRPTDHTPCIALGTDLQREDLGGVEPGHGKPSSAEDGGEEEHEEGGGTTHAAFVAFGCVCSSTSEAAGGEHADSLTDGAPVEGPATADTVECENAEEC